MHLVLIDGPSPKSHDEWIGRTCTNKKILIPRLPVPSAYAARVPLAPVDLQPGDYVAVEVVGARSGVTLHGSALGRTTIQDFAAQHQGMTVV